MKTFITAFVWTTLAAGQSSPDRIAGALQERVLSGQAARLKTDDRISLYNAMVQEKPENLHYQVLLAGAYIQKMRETTDFSYVDRASKVLDRVLAADSANYEALRLRTEVELERHNFKRVVEYSMQLIGIGPQDPWNWGTMGDAYIEIGDYDKAADAYQKMMNLRPDLSSYNRAAHYRFLMNDVEGAIDIMKRAIDSGSTSPENIAWCWVELGAYYLKSNRLGEAEHAYTNALRTFPHYHPALAGLGKVYTAQGKISEAIESFTQAQAIVPLPDYSAALYDLYLRQGKQTEANRQMATIDTIDKLAKANGEKVNRNLALIYADHDHRVDRALELAQAELDSRQDVYTYDALAWALYKNGKYAEAAAAIDKAVRFHTPEPAFQVHAQKIHEAALSARVAEETK
jgi:tetratricopeptide (TPR) repeat protein